MSSEAEKKAAFDEIDTDGDGFISAAELKAHVRGGTVAPGVSGSPSRPPSKAGRPSPP
ncbi:hypothetical protein ACFRAR_30530 [Kitasatospora sp. NPDC056651]|uniref:hypothetical protein n=1 Tax=Kitasatospora sp. NPDC056651 TaxID=3345892 RepID=UPI00368FB63D